VNRRREIPEDFIPHRSTIFWRNAGSEGAQAMDMGWVVGMVAVFMIFGGGSLIGKWIEGENEAKRIRAEKESGKSDASLALLQEMRREITTLRETTTRFDISFDAAITRLEQRMNYVESQIKDTSSHPVREDEESRPLELRGDHRR
jgi:hypothetical protein